MSQWEGEITQGDFARSTKRRLPICFCLDVSGSMMKPVPGRMGKTRIDEVNEAFANFITTMKANPDVAASADIAIITFGGKAQIVQPFVPLNSMNLTRINVNQMSLTPIGEAIQAGLKMLELRKQGYKEKGMKYYQPWLVVITDGTPEGYNAEQEMETAIKQANSLEQQSKVVVFNVAIGDDAGIDYVKRLSVKRAKPIVLAESDVAQLFEFLGSSSNIIVSGQGDEKMLYGEDYIDPNAPDIQRGEEIDISGWCI